MNKFIKKKRREFEQAIREYLVKKCPVVMDYQYADDFIEDSVKYYKLTQQVSQCPTNWLDIRNHRLFYADLAEASGLSYKDKWYKFEIEKAREYNNEF